MGSVEVLPSGRFRVRVWVKGRKTGDTFSTMEEAEAQRATLVVRHRRVAEALPAAPDVLTLAAWGKTWLERRETMREIRDPQEEHTRWARYLAGTALDAMPLADIRPKHVTEWVGSLLRRKRLDGKGPLSPRTIRGVFHQLRGAMTGAVRAEHIAANPCESVKLPKLLPSPWTFLTLEEIAAVERGAPGVPEAARRVFVVALYSGLREGELAGLRWGDVTLNGPRPELHVQRSYDGPTKNGKSRRVPLFPKAVEALALALADAEAAGAASPESLVFPGPRGGLRAKSDDFGWSPRRRHKRLVKGHRERFGIARRVVLHDTRHSCASHLVMGSWSDPWPLIAVSQFLGHSGVAVTERYAHLSPDFLHDRVGRGTEQPRGTTPAVPRPVTNHGESSEKHSSARRSSTSGENAGSPAVFASYGTDVGQRAFDLLRAVDEGTPAGDLARQLALDVLRAAAPDSPPWHRAVAVLEGGPLRMRHAVELAGLVVDAAAVEGEQQTG